MWLKGITYLEGGLLTAAELGALYGGASIPSPSPLSSTGIGVLSLGPLCTRLVVSGVPGSGDLFDTADRNKTRIHTLNFNW